MKTSGVYSVDVGWAARANPKTREHPRMRKLRQFCCKMPRHIVEEATLKMSEHDRAIVLKMLDEIQPVVMQ